MNDSGENSFDVLKAQAAAHREREGHRDGNYAHGILWAWEKIDDLQSQLTQQEEALGVLRDGLQEIHDCVRDAGVEWAEKYSYELRSGKYTPELQAVSQPQVDEGGEK